MDSAALRVFRLSLPAILAGGLWLTGCQKNSPASARTDSPGTEAISATPAPASAPATPPSTASTTPIAVASSPAAPSVPVAKGPPPAELWKEFNGEKAFANVQKQVEIGPRPAGTPELEKARALIEEGLRSRGWEAIRQTFTAPTPRGPTQFVNIIGRFSANGARPVGTNTQQVIVCSHYDTKRFTFIKFVGACDGASSTGSLLELARVLALDPALAAKTELVFFDGEEAMLGFTDPSVPEEQNDGLWGSRHYANDLEASGRAHQFKFGILWDMIGDADFKITLSPNSPPTLAKGIFDSAEALGLRGNFRYFDRDILDDHAHLKRVRIPAIDLIDFDIRYWHTADDTLDKLTPESLQKIGEVTLHYLKRELGK